MQNRKTKNILSDLIIYVILLIFTVFALFPVIYVLGGAFKTNSEILTKPELIFSTKPTFNNFIKAWNADNFNVERMILNSIWYTFASVAISLLTSSLAGYTFARGKFKLKKTLFAVFTSLMFINVGSITIYPQFEVLNAFHLNKGLAALLVMQFFGIGIANIYLVRNYVKTLSEAIDESARIDGCGFIGIFFKIIAPLLKPLFATLGILAFQASWNDYLMPTIFTLTVPKQRTLIVGIMALKSSGEGATNWNLMFAASSLALLPVLAAYTFANRYFVTGLANGAVKG